MKTIALAVNGEGYGHASRMATVAKALAADYRILVFAPLAIQPFIRQKLQECCTAVDFRDIPALRFAKRFGVIDYVKTISANLPLLVQARATIARIRRTLAVDEVDVLVSDFEPFCSFGARALGIRILQINHPGMVHRSPSLMPDALAAKATAGFMMGTWDKRLLVSFFDGDVGPMIRPSIVNAPRGNTGNIVVYLPPHTENVVVNTLQKLGERSYLLYPATARELPFEAALATARAVITGGGHQTLSECIYLGKPVFTLPVRGQYEQRLNAAMIEAGGYGLCGTVHRMSASLERFLTQVDAGQLPRKPAGPATLIRFNGDDWSERIIRRIVNFIEYEPTSRITPMSSLMLDSWLNREQELVSRDAT